MRAPNGASPRQISWPLQHHLLEPDNNPVLLSLDRCVELLTFYTTSGRTIKAETTASQTKISTSKPTAADGFLLALRGYESGHLQQEVLHEARSSKLALSGAQSPVAVTSFQALLQPLLLPASSAHQFPPSATLLQKLWTSLLALPLPPLMLPSAGVNAACPQASA